SISPTHINKDIQAKAIQSWIDLGMEVYSFNCMKEIFILKPLYPNVHFIVTNRTMELTYGKPLVSINSVMDWAKQRDEDHYCIINSDVELKTDKGFIERVKLKMEDAIILDNRID